MYFSIEVLCCVVLFSLYFVGSTQTPNDSVYCVDKSTLGTLSIGGC